MLGKDLLFSCFTLSQIVCYVIELQLFCYPTPFNWFYFMKWAGGIWPANDAMQICYEARCPSSSDIDAAMKMATGKDALALARQYPNIPLSKFQKAVGPSGTESSSSSKAKSKSKKAGEL